LILGILLFVVYTIFPKYYNFDKISVYECGFDPFQSSRIAFDVKFYLVALLFLVFDLEVTIFFPLVVEFRYNIISVLTIFCLFLIVILSFYVEFLFDVLSW
jgi:NADH:ubiquinone oxidoreductase subunit 3 (subunit A)